MLSLVGINLPDEQIYRESVEAIRNERIDMFLFPSL